MEFGVLTIALAVFAFALVARRVSDLVVTPPLTFLALGWLVAETGLVDAAGGEEVLHLLAEVTLIIVLFSDAASIDAKQLRSGASWPARMLIIGMPLMIGLGFLSAVGLLPGWSIWEVALLAAILAPTDAALGQAVVTNPAVPDRVRRTLNVESGLNDGMALPAILFFACIAVGGVHDGRQNDWLEFAAEQIGYGAVIGVVLGLAGGWLITRASARGWSSEAFEGIGVLALAGICYLAAVEVGGNGFVAAFIGGLAFGQVARHRCTFVFEFMEAEGQALILLTFLLIGVALLPHAAHAITLPGAIIVLLSLFVVRPLAMWLALVGSRARPVTRLFLGWFGPRGLATALFALLVLEQFDNLPHGDEMLTIAIVAVAASALLHGLSAAPGARWFGRRAGEDTDSGSENEMKLGEQKG